MPARRRNSRARRLLGTTKRARPPKRDLAGRLTRAVEPPAHLNERQASEWRALMPAVVALGTISRADLRAFELLCVTLAAETEAREAIQRDGMTIEAGSGGKKAHPALKAAETARMQAKQLLESFGLTPKGRQSIDVLPPDDRRCDPAKKYFDFD